MSQKLSKKPPYKIWWFFIYLYTMPNHTHYVLPIEVVDNQLLSLYSQLKEQHLTQYNRGIIQGLIEAYLAIQMQEKIVLPNKKFL